MRRAGHGFTLLEVMVALAILSFGLVGISDLVGGAMRNHARAKQLDVATLLARGKLAELEDHYDEEGFRDFDESDEGRFEAEGHPEVAWKVLVRKPDVELGGENACAALLGDKGLSALLPSTASGGAAGAGASAGGSSRTTQSPIALQLETLVKAQCATFGETLKKSFRELRLKVSWKDGRKDEGFDVVTHLVVLQPRKGQP